MCSIGICTESSMEFGFLHFFIFFIYLFIYLSLFIFFIYYLEDWSAICIYQNHCRRIRVCCELLEIGNVVQSRQ